jgi:crotonobetainyl-CoA:carnitine CoA-transferase CaiB-like acyl-CoA transferase
MRSLHVLEIAGSIAGAYCGRLFATTGADVVLVESPDGAPVRRSAPWIDTPHGERRSAPHEYLDAAKRSATFDLAGADGDAALAWADLVIVSVNGDVDSATELHRRIDELNPAAVVVAVSGFGLSGPYATWRTSPLVEWAAGGYLYLNGEPDREPLQGGGPWASMVTGATAAVGAQAALLERTVSGVGQLVDVGAMEAVAAGHQWSLTMYTHIGAVKKRWGLRFGESFHPMGMYRCRDAWIMIGAASREQWERLCLATDTAELLIDEELYAPAARFERAEEIDAQLQPWMSEHGADEAVEILQANRVPASKVLDFVQVLDSEQLASRGFWAGRPDIAPTARMPRAPFRLDNDDVGRPAPALGADTEAFLAEARGAVGTARPPMAVVDLARAHVVEFSIAWAGPLTGRILADLGAHVVKVEHPASRGLGTTGKASQIGGSSAWKWGTLPNPQIRAEVFPSADPGDHWWNRMGVWNKMNRGKRSLCIDAKTPDGKDVLAKLVERADVVVHNYTPRGAASLGIDADSLARHNDRIVSVAMTGYGETGPMASHSSYGPILEACGGLDEATGYIGEGPMRLGLAFPDAVGGLHGAFAVLTALWERAESGRSVHVDLSQLETLLSLVGDGVLASSVSGTAPARHGNRSDDYAPQGVYRGEGDDTWLALTVTTDDDWRALVDLLADDDVARLRDASIGERVAEHDRIDAAIARWSASLPPGVAAARLQAAGVAACPAFSNKDLVEDEHLRARGFIVEWDQADVGRARFPGYPIHFERMKPVVRGAPALGADNATTLAELGYDAAAIARMAAAEVIFDRPPA